MSEVRRTAGSRKIARRRSTRRYAARVLADHWLDSHVRRTLRAQERARQAAKRREAVSD